jgi:hypothetical protein
LNGYKHGKRERNGSDGVSGQVDDLIEELKPLTVPGAEPANCTLILLEVSTFEAAEFRLAEYFDANPSMHEVNLVIADRQAGVVSRETLRLGAGLMAGDSPASPVGAADGMQLPGFSTRYRLLEFTCPQCASQYRIHYDERDIPACAHGRMELRP